MEIKESLLTVILNYAKTHDFISKSYIVGNFSDYNPRGGKVYRDDYERTQHKKVMRKIGSVFTLLKNLGICEKYNRNAVKVNREKLDEYSLQDILKYKNSDFNKK